MSRRPGVLEVQAAARRPAEAGTVLAALVLEMAPVALVAIGPSALIVACNAAGAALFGRTRDAMLGLPVYDLFPRAARRPLMEQVHAALRSAAVGERLQERFRTLGLRPGSVTFPVELSVTALDLAGEPLTIIGFGDRTEAANAEAESVVATAAFRAFAEHGFEALTIHSGSLIRDCNPAFCELVGTTRGDAIGSSLFRFAAPEAAAEVRRALARRGSSPYETLLLRADGSRVPVQVRRRRIRFEGRPAFLVGVRDITAEVEQRRRLTAGQQPFRLVFERSFDAILISIPDGTILEANDAACRMFGMSVQAIRRAGRLGLTDHSDPRWADALRTRRETGVFAGELSFVRGDGTTFPADVMASNFVDEEGRQRSSLILRDVTERHEAEARLRAALAAEQSALDRLDELSTAKSQFISMLSHDLRTGLVAIGWLTAPLAAPETPSDQRAILGEQVRDEAQRLIRLLDDVLELDRLESGRLVLRHGAVDLRELLQTVVAPLRLRGRKVDVDLGPTPPVLDGDTDRLAQVFVNILSNAEKYSPPGTRIRIGAETTAGFAHVWVRNRGEPIPAGQLDSIFERFFRAEPKDGRTTAGSGLGLAIVRDIVELHGGSISAESTRREGTTIHLRLPLAAAAAGSGRGAA